MPASAATTPSGRAEQPNRCGRAGLREGVESLLLPPHPSRRAAQRRAPQDEGFFARPATERLTLRRSARLRAGRLEGWAARTDTRYGVGAICALIAASVIMS